MYRSDSPTSPTTYGRGGHAEAEPPSRAGRCRCPICSGLPDHLQKARLRVESGRARREEPEDVEQRCGRLSRDEAHAVTVRIARESCLAETEETDAASTELGETSQIRWSRARPGDGSSRSVTSVVCQCAMSFARRSLGGRSTIARPHVAGAQVLAVHGEPSSELVPVRTAGNGHVDPLQAGDGVEHGRSRGGTGGNLAVSSSEVAPPPDC